MWDVSAFLLGQNLSQYWQWKPGDCICLACICLVRSPLRLLTWSHSTHLQTTTSPFTSISFTILDCTAAEICSFVNQTNTLLSKQDVKIFKNIPDLDINIRLFDVKTHWWCYTDVWYKYYFSVQLFGDNVVTDIEVSQCNKIHTTQCLYPSNLLHYTCTTRVWCHVTDDTCIYIILASQCSI